VVSTPKMTGTPVARAGVHEPARALARDVVEVRRVAADHAAERDHRFHGATGREHLGGQRQFEGTRNAFDEQARRITAVRDPRLRAPSMSWSTSSALKRAAMMTTRRRVASNCCVLVRDPVMGAGVYRSVSHVTR
jgi:hypothetical protein